MVTTKNEISEEIIIERTAEFGIVLEKSYTVQLAYEHLKEKKHVANLKKVLNPIWGEDILYFDYKGKSIVALSAKGAPSAVNAVERVRRTGGKYITLIGTCGSTNEAISDGTYVLANSGVRDEGVSSGYLDLKVPALADEKLVLDLKAKLVDKGINPIVGVAFTTDRRYKENPKELLDLNKRVGVVYVDMETSAFLLVSRYHNIKAASIKIVTDCAVKETEGELKGIFDRSKDFVKLVNPKLMISLDTILEMYAEL